MSHSRRPSISVRDYPEHLNPFNDRNVVTLRIKENKESPTEVKESKRKFWTFGRSKKKRHNSFSLKSTWNGLFGRHKDSSDRRATVSQEYQKGQNGKPPCRFSTEDQKDFDDALGTLARRRKYTYESASRCSSNPATNGTPGRIYDENPQDTATSIMGDVTPKAPARRFGQVSPRPTDKIPAFNYGDKDLGHNGSGADTEPDKMPVPPKRNTLRASQRTMILPRPQDPRDLEASIPADAACSDVALRNGYENDYPFKRFNQDPSRMSNLSINSCISISSTTSYARKKKRAPQPPRRLEIMETPKENRETPKTEEGPSQEPEKVEKVEKVEEEKKEVVEEAKRETLEVESRELPQEVVEVVKEAETCDDLSQVPLRMKPSLSRSNSFSVKEEIEKIEKQIKELEAKKSSDVEEEGFSPRLSIQENRRSFFNDMLGEEASRVDVKVAEVPRVQNDFSIVRLSEPPKGTVKVIELHISEPIKQKPERLPSSIPIPRRSSSLSYGKRSSVDSVDVKASKISL